MTTQTGSTAAPVSAYGSAALRMAALAYLARFKGLSRAHTESDLRAYLSWCAERNLDPLRARRPHVELYLRWLQEVRHLKPSTVGRRATVVIGFYRTCVIDGTGALPSRLRTTSHRARRVTDAGAEPPPV